MDTPLVILLVALGAVLVALAIAWVPLRVLLIALGKSVGQQVRELVRRSRDRRRRPRGTPDRRSDWTPGQAQSETEALSDSKMEQAPRETLP